MYVPSNTYISRADKKSISAWVIVALLIIGLPVKTRAQQVHVEPLKKTSPSPAIIDLCAFGSGGLVYLFDLRTANQNTAYTPKQLMYQTSLNAGISAETNWSNTYGIRTSLGYQYGRLALEKGFPDNSGIHAYWITMDLDFLYKFFLLGLSSNIFLNSHIRNYDHFTYEGIYSSCFNRIALNTYLGYALKFSSITVEGDVGLFLTPILNPNQMAYHNLTYFYSESFFFKIKLSYRIFTTGKQIRVFSIY